ncbi:hypothetical protein J4558_24400 [Leptolyngbya sp. 15MV]|nr:hypothetical protein J4558_24400 [Leptolyngbya sp. 15MV]
MVAALGVVCACLAPPALGAQPAGDATVGRGAARVAVLADFGFVGNVVAHRWTPIFVTVDPGLRGLSGTVEVEFTQDESQRARIAVPFAATAGTPTRVQAVAALPLDVPRVQVRVVDESGLVRASTMYSKLASDTAAQLPPILPPETAMVVAAGRSSVLAASRAWRTRSSAANRWTTVVVSPSLDLPTDSIAYDGAAAMVVTARINFLGQQSKRLVWWRAQLFCT